MPTFPDNLTPEQWAFAEALLDNAIKWMEADCPHHDAIGPIDGQACQLCGSQPLATSQEQVIDAFAMLGLICLHFRSRQTGQPGGLQRGNSPKGTPLTVEVRTAWLREAT
jgi:hypothetical protein